MGKRLLVWFQDEARVGQQGTTTRLWAPKEIRPRALKQLGFESASVFGSVCPGKGMAEGIV
ncbi:MAG: IS630 family transposase, partial [Myxococcota bacterium]